VKITRTLRRATLDSTCFGQREPLRFRNETLQKRSRKIEQIFRVLLGEIPDMRAVIGILSDAFCELAQI